MKKVFPLILGLTLALHLFSASLPWPVFAASEIPDLINEQLDPIGDVYGQDQVDPNALSRTIAEVIRVILGFLGVIFLVLILYAGFMWMTSAGNDEKIATAKKTMVAAIIGAAIVLLAFAFNSFVITKLFE